MDQFVVELGDPAAAEPGDEVMVFGPGDQGEPTAADWADWCGTIGYEIVTRIGPRVPRRYPEHPVRTLPDGGDGTGSPRASGWWPEWRACRWGSRRGPGARAPGDHRSGSTGTPRPRWPEFFAAHRRFRVTTPDGVVLHTEVELAARRRSHRGLRPWLRAEHGLLAFPAPPFAGEGPSGPLRPAVPRPVGRSAPDHCRLPQLADDLAQVLDEVVGEGPVVLVGHSMGGMTIMRLAQTRPELFGSRIRGVALFHTAAGEMADHSPIKGFLVGPSPGSPNH